MTRSDVIAWKRGQERAAERSWELRAAQPASAGASFKRSNSLLQAIGDVVSSPFNEEARRQQTEIARAAWIKLRQKYAARDAAIAHGSSRVTTDVDATIWIDLEDLEPLLARFQEAGFSPREADAVAFAHQTRVLLLRHDASGVELDLSIAALSFEERALDRAEMRQVGRIKVRVAHPTDLIIYKMVAHRTRDLDDAEAMVRLHRDRIDFAEIDSAVAEFAALLEDAAPHDAWAEVKRRTARLGTR